MTGGDKIETLFRERRGREEDSRTEFVSRDRVLRALATEPVATQLVTVAELEQALAEGKGWPDKTLSVQLSDMRPTERLGDAQLSRLESEMPGRLAKVALLAVAEESAFLDPPAAEIPSLPAPEHATQVELIDRAADYVLKTILTLPDFSATRTTTRFMGTPLAVPACDAKLGPGCGSPPVPGSNASQDPERYAERLELFPREASCRDFQSFHLLFTSTRLSRAG